MNEDEIRRMEAVAALGWQAPDQEWLGRWLLRAAGGFTGRANSALPLGRPDRPLPDAVDLVERWYGDRGLRPCIVVPHPLPWPHGDPLEALLVDRGWPLREGPAIVMTARSAEIAPAAGVPVDLRPEPDDEWAALYHYRGGTLPPVAGALLLSAPFQRFASVRIDGRVAAIGRVALAEGWAGITGMEVDPDHRRCGLGTSVLSALAAVARQEGVEQLYLQVDETNTAGRALYAAAGFTDRYRYHYRLAPDS